MLANVAPATTGGMTAHVMDVERSGLPNLSNEQWQALVEMLNNHKGNANERMTGKWSTWIIDIEASNHMTWNLDNLHGLRDVKDVQWGYQTEKKATTTKEGIAILVGGLKLENVIYVPRFNCSLISVSQLIDETKCIIQFTKSLCVMQDRTSKMLIGAGERRDGLYFF